MTHLSDVLLNEYLDHTLSSSRSRAVEAHLAKCPSCSSRLEELLSMASTLETLADELPSPGLAVSILRQLPRRRNSLARKLVFALQAGIAIGLVLALGSAYLETIDIEYLIGAALVRWPNFSLPNFPSLPLHFSTPQIPSFQFQLPIVGIWFIAAAALILWIVGNIALLRPRSGVKN